MRRALIIVGWVVLAGGVFAGNRYISNLPSPLRAKRAEIPEPRTIAELRDILKVTTAKPCDLPAVAAPSGSTVLAGPDEGFATRVPSQWRRTASSGQGKSFPDDPQVSYAGPAGNWITITRLATGAAGPMYHADSAFNPLPSETCELNSGTSGTIWSFTHDATSGFRAIGEAVTPPGKRYRFNVTAPSAPARDSLAALISAAVLECSLTIAQGRASCGQE